MIIEVSVPVVPSCLLEPIWTEFDAVLRDADDRGGPVPGGPPRGGLKRSVATEVHGLPLGIVSAGANRHDCPLLAPPRPRPRRRSGPLPADITAHLDAGYDSAITRALLAGLGLTGRSPAKGVPAPIQVGNRWVVERSHAWMNGNGKLRRCTDKDGA